MFCTHNVFLSLRLETAEMEHPASQEDPEVSSDSPTPPATSPEDGQIVTLVVEEEEEPKQSTVTLMEEDGDEEEAEEREEQMRREARRKRRESQVYCPLSSLSSLSLSCMATLPELLHRWCSARLAKERQRSLRRKQPDAPTQTHPETHTQAITHTPPQISVPVPIPTSTLEVLPLTEKVPEPEVPPQGQNEGKPPADAHTPPHTHPGSHTPDTSIPEPPILLEPSRTSTIPPHSFSDTSLTRPTPTQEEKPLPPIKDAALDPVPPPALQGVPVPETLGASSATPTPTPSSPLLPQASETASLDLLIPLVKEQPVQPLPTATRPTDMIPPPTQVPVAPPQPDTHTDLGRAGAENGDSHRHNVQASLTEAEHSDSLTHTGEPHRGEDSVDDLLLSTAGNGNIHRTATDFYAELQSVGDYGGGVVNGNGGLNGGAVHGSSQKESVFMRLNNRIKALEMNMSLSSRYLEELSQR